MNNREHIIRCRETGLYYAPHVVGHWVEHQDDAFLYDSLNEALAEVQAPHFTTQCWHIVWPGWSPSLERRTFREWMRDAWTSFKHNLFQ